MRAGRGGLRRSGRALLHCGIAALVPICLAPALVRAAEPPQRIVSLNLCADEIVIDLVSPDRIAALSHLAADPLVSPVAERARAFASTRGEAESVLTLAPDLVLAGAFTTPATLDLLQRTGQRIVRVPMADDIAGVRAAVRLVASAVGESAKGEALVARFDAALAAGAVDAPAATSRPSALVYQVNGLSAGPSTLADALIGAAGLVNHAATLGLGAGDALPLETLVARPPDLVILSGPADEYRTVVADNLRHPALAAVLAERRSVIVPWRYWLCGSHHAGVAVTRLAEARRALSGPVR